MESCAGLDPDQLERVGFPSAPRGQEVDPSNGSLGPDAMVYFQAALLVDARKFRGQEPGRSRRLEPPAAWDRPV